MGLAEARDDLCKNFVALRVKKRNGEIWRTTLAGTPWVLLEWGYSEGELRYELHVHGNSKNRVTETTHAAKVCGANLKGGECYLDTRQWQMISATVKRVIGQQ